MQPYKAFSVRREVGSGELLGLVRRSPDEATGMTETAEFPQIILPLGFCCEMIFPCGLPCPAPLGSECSHSVPACTSVLLSPLSGEKVLSNALVLEEF